METSISPEILLKNLLTLYMRPKNIKILKKPINPLTIALESHGHNWDKENSLQKYQNILGWNSHDGFTVLTIDEYNTKMLNKSTSEGLLKRSYNVIVETSSGVYCETGDVLKNHPKKEAFSHFIILESPSKEFDFNGKSKKNKTKAIIFLAPDFFWSELRGKTAKYPLWITHLSKKYEIFKYIKQ